MARGQVEGLGLDASGWAHTYEAPLATPMTTSEDPSFRIDANAILVRECEWQVVEDSHRTLRLSDLR